MPFLADQAVRAAAGAAAKLIPTSPGVALWSGMKFAGMGTLAGAGVMAYQVGRARRGEVVSSLLGYTGGLVTYPALSGTFAAGGALAASVLGIPAVGAGVFAAAAALYPEVWIGNQIGKGIRVLNNEGHRLRELEFGSGFKDNQTNQALRAQALYEMSGATTASRRYLGQEAYFLHR